MSEPFSAFCLKDEFVQCGCRDCAVVRRALNLDRCRHCGKPPEADGDHSCPCPHRDDDCPDHPIGNEGDEHG